MESAIERPPAGEEAQTTAERKQQELQAQLRQAQKMEVMGQLAGGIAHDFNNALTVILGYCELLKEEMLSEDPKHTQVQEMYKAADQANNMTRQLLTFSSKQALAPRVLDLNTVVAQMQSMVQRLIGEHIQLAILLAPNVGHVKADRGQLEQVLMNLAVNARDAMPQGGSLTITTTNVYRDAADVRPFPGVQPGPHVSLAVQDTGCGMSAETKAHLFEPFFTTKEKGKGTGLGLATVYGIVQQSGGHIVVHSELQRGSLFQIYLPRVEAAVEPAERPKPAVKTLYGSETVLVAEDEPQIHTLLKTILAHYGYTVLAGTSTHEALSLCLQHPRRIHLLVTDVVMPGMSGPALAERVLPFQPGIKVLYISGYPDDMIFQHGVAEPAPAFLQKPFTATMLAQKVREVLDPEAG